MRLGFQSTDTSACAVLHVSGEVAEWFERAPDGAPRYGLEPVRGAGPEDVVRAALLARGNAGGTALRCVVALGAKLVEQRSIPLPEIARADLHKVLGRKAANLLEARIDDTLFAALPYSKDASNADTDGTEQKWHLVALKRSFASGLRVALRRARLHVVRLVEGSSARLCHADRIRGERDKACIMIDVDSDDVVVSLFCSDMLAMQSRIHGSFESVPTLALSLIQELKSIDAYRRKTSRGDAVEQVVVLGVESERSKLFALAITTALPQVRVVLSPDESSAVEAPHGVRAGRVAALEACTADGPFLLDLTSRLPVRYGYAATLAACVLLLTGGVGAVAHERMSRSLSEILEQSRRLEGRAEELDELRAQNQATEQVLARAIAESERLVLTQSWGVPLRATLDDVLGASRGRAEISQLSAQRDSSGGQLRVRGWTGSAPLSSMRSLTAIQAQLEESPRLQSVEVSSPTKPHDPQHRGDADALEFEVVARWEGAAP